MRQRQAGRIVNISSGGKVSVPHLVPYSASKFALGNQLLPSAGGVGTETKKGRESASVWSPSWLTTLNEQAAIRNNEVLH